MPAQWTPSWRGKLRQSGTSLTPTWRSSPRPAATLSPKSSWPLWSTTQRPSSRAISWRTFTPLGIPRRWWRRARTKLSRERRCWGCTMHARRYVFYFVFIWRSNTTHFLQALKVISEISSVTMSGGGAASSSFLSSTTSSSYSSYQPSTSPANTRREPPPPSNNWGGSTVAPPQQSRPPPPTPSGKTRKCKWRLIPHLWMKVDQHRQYQEGQLQGRHPHHQADLDLVAFHHPWFPRE